MNRLKLRTALLVFVAMAGVNVLLMGGLAVWQDQQQSQVTDRLVGDVHLARAVGTADMMHDALRGTAYRALLAGPRAPAAEKQAVQAELQDYTKNFDKALEEFRQGSASPELQHALGEAGPVVQRYTRSAAQLVQDALSGAAESQAHRDTFLADFKLLEDKLEALAGLVEKRAEQTLAEREHTQQRTHVATALAVFISLVALLAYGFALARSLMQQLGAEPPHLRQFATSIAQGHLAARLLGAATVPAGSVAAAMTSMQKALCDAVASIRESSDSVATGSEQIASGNQELSSRTERQASRLQATAASMEELSGSVKQTAGHARLASELADSASRVAQLGGVSVQRVEQTMAALQASSNRIADITGVIDSIAFQTNILALNAAVEAARAGEQGRGFAVVASEVRGLAQRSANAAREIKSLIQASSADVEAGNRTVVEAGHTMRDIQSGVQRVTELISQIHTASSQQDNGIGQVAVSVADLDRDTQGNAALVEETAAASQSLSEQAQRLAQAVASFQLRAA